MSEVTTKLFPSVGFAWQGCQTAVHLRGDLPVCQGWSQGQEGFSAENSIIDPGLYEFLQISLGLLS